MRKKHSGYTKLFITFCLITLIASCHVENKPTNITKEVTGNLEPVNDAALYKKFLRKAQAYYVANGGADANTFKPQTLRKKCDVRIEQVSSDLVERGDFYNQFKQSVLIVGMLSNNADNGNYEMGTASAFSISRDGVCVTNYHVFKSFNPAKPSEYEAIFVMDSEGEVYPVVEVLAASKHDDLAIFRIDSKGKEMLPLALASDLSVGEEINLISHPARRFYSYSQGSINRTYMKPGTNKIRQCISAEFAKGSSGAPILDKLGNVVAVVAGTQNIHALPSGSSYQMTIREIIPVSRIKELLK